MDPVAIIIMLVIGAVAGWLAGLIYSGAGFGLVGNIIVGILGAIIAGTLLPSFLHFWGSSARSSPTRLAPSFCCF
jgi:uncharacterized membrane protein YeaQ/YmgE (transglycosylase-associated protein family)